MYGPASFQSHMCANFSYSRKPPFSQSAVAIS